MNYADWTFNTFEELSNNIDEWASKITVHDLYQSDFIDLGSSTGMQDAISLDDVEHLFVEPCEMVVIQVTLPWDFSNNWIVENRFQLNDFGFVDAFNIAEEDEDARYRGAYAIRFPCDAVPG